MIPRPSGGLGSPAADNVRAICGQTEAGSRTAVTQQLDERGEVLLYESQLEFIVESFSLPADVAGEATQTGLIRIALNPDVIQVGRYNPATCAFWMRIGLFVTIPAIGGPYPVMVVGEGTLDLITRAYKSRGTFSILEGPFAGLDGVYAKGCAEETRDCPPDKAIQLTLAVGKTHEISLGRGYYSGSNAPEDGPVTVTG